VVSYQPTIAATEMPAMAADPIVDTMTPKQLRKSIENTRRLMQEAAKRLDFMEAAQYRDEILRLTALLDEKEKEINP
jgi:excinuclease ABC subunit B